MIKLLKIDIILLFINIKIILKYIKNVINKDIKMSFYKKWDDPYHYFCNGMTIFYEIDIFHFISTYQTNFLFIFILYYFISFN